MKKPGIVPGFVCLREFGRPALTLRVLLTVGEVGEGFVRVGHFVDVVAGGHRGAFLAAGGDEFIGEAFVHGFAGLGAGGFDHPADGQRLLTLAIHGHGNLIVCPAHAARPHFDRRLHVVQGVFKHVDGLHILDALFDDFQGAVDATLGGRLLAVIHEAVDELGKAAGCQRRDRVWRFSMAGRCVGFGGHIGFPLFLPDRPQHWGGGAGDTL